MKLWKRPAERRWQVDRLLTDDTPAQTVSGSVLTIAEALRAAAAQIVPGEQISTTSDEEQAIWRSMAVDFLADLRAVARSESGRRVIAETVHDAGRAEAIPGRDRVSPRGRARVGAGGPVSRLRRAAVVEAGRVVTVRHRGVLVGGNGVWT